jgi:integrase/recombinase XerD
MDELPKYVRRKRSRHGKEYLQFQRSRHSPAIQIHEPFDSPEFWARYAELRDGNAPLPRAKAKPVVKGSLRDLCEDFMQSPKWRGYEDNTRDVYLRMMRLICDKYGDLPIRLLSDEHLIAYVDSIENTSVARKMVCFLHLVFGNAIRRRRINYNPTHELKCRPLDNPDGHHTWTEPEIEQFEAAHPIETQARFLFVLLLETGARISDVYRMGPANIRDGLLHYDEFKGRKQGVKHTVVPVSNYLRHVIDNTPHGGESTAHRHDHARDT